MRIVPQSAVPSYWQVPPMLALPAPASVAGLLTARVPSSEAPQITVFKAPPRESLLDRQRSIWAAQDAQIEAFLNGTRQRLADVYAEVMQDRGAHTDHSARSYIWEIAS